MVLLILLFVYRLIKFTWSLRQFNFVTIFIGSLSPKDPVTDDDRNAARRAAGILKLAGENFGQGMRSYYFAVAVLMWFVQPLGFIAMLYRIEFNSRTINVPGGK